MKTFEEITATTLDRCLMRIRPWTAPGIDGVTRDEFRLAGGCSILARDLHGGTYSPLPNRRSWLAKPNGERRPIAVPTIRDRVAQRAVSAILSARYEPVFSDASFGFRPARKAEQAVRRVMRAIEERSTAVVVEFDIRSFFDTVRHAALLGRLAEDGVDGRVVALVAAFLTAPIVEAARSTTPTIGTPQGGPLSPILANVILDLALDAWFPKAVRERGWPPAELIRFADDFVVIVNDEVTAEDVLDQVGRRLFAFGLEVHPEKTRLVRVRAPRRGERGDSFDFLGWTIRFEEFEHGRRLVRRTSFRSIKRTLQRLTREMRGDDWRTKTAGERHDWFLAVLRGHREYFLVPGNEAAVRHFEDEFASRFDQAAKRIWPGADDPVSS